MRALLVMLDSSVRRNTRRVFRRVAIRQDDGNRAVAAETAARVPPYLLLFMLLLTLPALAHADGPAELSDEELGRIEAQQGVLLNLKLSNNVDEVSNAPIGCTAVVGAPNPCRMGLEFAARTGTWFMLKEYFGTFQLKDLRLDIVFLPAVASGFHDPARFDATGNGACTSPLLPSCRPNGRPALQLTFPGTDAPAVYDDFLSFLNIGRVWLEFDNAGTPGMQRDTSTNSMFGVRMSDSRALNEPAHMRFMGKGFVYGF